jgi:hypothetical protein
LTIVKLYSIIEVENNKGENFMQYLIYEGNMERLQKKLQRIENKCKKYGNADFHFEIQGEEYKEIKDENGCVYNNKYYVVEVSGTAKVNDWIFVATIQHKDKGNVIRQFKTDIEIPEKYRYTDSICEHCNYKRVRKDTYLVYNEVTKEFKQVGKSCLKDFTNGLSAENVAQYISWFDEIIEGQEVIAGGKPYYSVETVLLHAIETVKHYGFVGKAMAMESENPYIITTSDRVIDFMFPHRMRNTKEILQEMERVNYNSESEENKAELVKILDWLDKTDSDSQYIYNLKTTVNNMYCESRDFGLLVSLPSAYFKAFEREQDKIIREQKRAEREQINANKQYVGEIGQRLDIEIENAECITSFPTNYGIMMIYKFITADDNILIWKTTNFIEETDKVKKIKATIKNHSEYRNEKQTEVSRVKIIG